MRKKTTMQDLEWLCKHPEISEQYRGKHIAVVDEKVVAFGEDFEEVAKQAEEFDEDPLFSFIPEEEVLIL
jgi:hypothetical protein